jgi:uncharacterized protein YndB with AHSA1/START domain
VKADIVVDVIYPYPIERVWTALTTSEGLAAWLMPNDFEAVTGHSFEMRTKPAPGFDGIVHCEVLELDPPGHMVWSWRGGKVDTTVTFTLEDLDGERTRFHMRQLGFHGLGGRLTRLIMQGGYGRIYGSRLPAHLARRATTTECAEGWHAALPWNWKRAS